MAVPFAKQILTDNHLKAIGLVAAEWSYSETILQDLIWEIAGIDHERGYAITSDLGSETRINMLEALAHTRLQSTEIKAKLKKIVSEIRRLRTERNSIIHSLWLSSKPTPIPVTMLNNLRKRKSTPKSIHIKAKGKVVITNKPYTSKEILGTASEITELFMSMTDLLTTIENGRKRREALAKALREHPTPALSLDPKTKGSALPPQSSQA